MMTTKTAVPAIGVTHRPTPEPLASFGRSKETKRTPSRSTLDATTYPCRFRIAASASNWVRPASSIGYD